jgi:hypothetical protein
MLFLAVSTWKKTKTINKQRRTKTRKEEEKMKG